jgi:hypothetical protein
MIQNEDKKYNTTGEYKNGALSLIRALQNFSRHL